RGLVLTEDPSTYQVRIAMAGGSLPACGFAGAGARLAGPAGGCGRSSAPQRIRQDCTSRGLSMRRGSTAPHCCRQRGLSGGASACASAGVAASRPSHIIAPAARHLIPHLQP
ncbi:hypothetical protein MHZ93_24560, partial [Roseomonas sp. ACRSG]|nr:hypothetical protein [Roseomonas sp. ACRSG]